MPFSIGETVGSYQIIEQLGHGGMATVFKAYHPSLDRDVALKVLHPAFKNDPQFFARFQREARIVAKLEHPNIVPVYDFSEHHGEPYLVMRYVKGDTLKAEINGEAFPIEKILRIMEPVCSALSYAHKQGILHRDIKPSNIMIAEEGNVFLTDFGLARMMELGESTLSQDMMVGTPQYISPEQAQGQKDIDGRADIYALGVVLFEMLTGSVPYSADTPFAIIHDHIYKPLPLPRSLNPDIDEKVEKVVLRALAKNPEDRYDNMDDFWEALKKELGHVMAEKTTIATAVPKELKKKKKKRNYNKKKIIIGSALIFFSLCICTLIIIGSASNTEGEPTPIEESAPSEENMPPQFPADQPAEGERPPNSDAEKLVFEGIKTAEAGDIPQAMDLFEQAINVDPHFLPAYFHAANTIQPSDPDRAEDYLMRAIDNNAAQPEPLALMGYYLTRRGDFEQATNFYEEALSIDPDYGLAYAGMARIAIEDDDMGMAEEYLNQAMEMNPDAAEVNIVEALFLWSTGDRRKALKIVRELVQRPNLSPWLREELRNMADDMNFTP